MGGQARQETRRIETKWDSFFADRVVELGALAEARRFGQGATGASADSSRANRARDGGIREQGGQVWVREQE